MQKSSSKLNKSQSSSTINYFPANFSYLNTYSNNNKNNNKIYSIPISIKKISINNKFDNENINQKYVKFKKEFDLIPEEISLSNLYSMKRMKTPYKKNLIVKTIKKNYSMSKIKTYNIKFPYVIERSKSDEKYEINNKKINFNYNFNKEFKFSLYKKNQFYEEKNLKQKENNDNYIKNKKENLNDNNSKLDNNNNNNSSNLINKFNKSDDNIINNNSNSNYNNFIEDFSTANEEIKKRKENYLSNESNINNNNLDNNNNNNNNKNNNNNNNKSQIQLNNNLNNNNENENENKTHKKIIIKNDSSINKIKLLF